MIRKGVARERTSLLAVIMEKYELGQQYANPDLLSSATDDVSALASDGKVELMDSQKVTDRERAVKHVPAFNLEVLDQEEEIKKPDLPVPALDLGTDPAKHAHIR